MKLHLGCGKRNFGPSWHHFDQAEFDHLDGHNITELPFEDDTVDLIYASHVIEYFDRDEVIPLLEEWYRVLCVGGVLRVAVPDFETIASRYVVKGHVDTFLGLLYGKMDVGGGKTIYHKTVYDLTSLANLLWKIGFRDITQYDWRRTEHAHIDDHSQAYLPHMDKENGTLVSLNVEAVKK